MNSSEKELFETMPVRRAVITLVVPAVISQLITVIYNMADTFFIGQTGDPAQVAAAHLCMPPMFFMTGLANLFGLGSASLMSRSLGAGNEKGARQSCAFGVWSSAAVALMYSLFIWLFMPSLVSMLGANSVTELFCHQYLYWVVCVGAFPTILNMELAHFIRAEGLSHEASFGMALGGMLNVALDPLFVLVFGWGIEGAAVATMLSNTAALMYFLLLLRSKRAAVVSMNPQWYPLGNKTIAREVLLVGLPGAFMVMMSVFSNVMLSRLVAGYGTPVIAGMSIAKKIDMLAFSVGTGISQGVLPLVGYTYSSGDRSRMMAVIQTTLVLSLCVSVSGALGLFTLAAPVVKAFITDAATVKFGQYFQRVLCVTGPCTTVTLIVITVFQAVGLKRQPMILSFLRKGGLDVPVMLLMNVCMGVKGLAFASPVADFCAMCISLALFWPFWRRFQKEPQKRSGMA